MLSQKTDSTISVKVELVMRMKISESEFKKKIQRKKVMFWKRKNSQEEILAKLEEFLCAGREMMER